jgi:hypothetical protein
MLYGIHGVGKSSWAAQAPGAIFLNVEDGVNDIDCASTDHLKSYEAVLGAIDWLQRNEHPYKTVVVDTIDWVEQLIFKDICTQAGVTSVADIDFGKGFPRAIPKWKLFLELLDNLRRTRNMAVILLAHSRVEKFSNPEGSTYDRYAPDLWTNARGEGAGNMIQEWCDEVFFASFRVFTTTEGKGFNEKVVAVGGKERYIRTSESASCLAKNRLGLPDELPMDFNVYASHIRQRLANVKPAEVGVNVAGIVVDGSSKRAELKAEVEAELAEALG